MFENACCFTVPEDAGMLILSKQFSRSERKTRSFISTPVVITFGKPIA
jgi:hypothetical protein